MTAATIAPEQAEREGTAAIDWTGVKKRVLDALSAYCLEHADKVAESERAAGEEFRIEMSGLRYPDTVGTGKVVVVAYSHLGKCHISAEVEHNRVFKGGRSPLFLNDFKFHRLISATRSFTKGDADALLAGLEASRTALVARELRMKKAGTVPLFLRTEAAERP